MPDLTVITPHPAGQGIVAYLEQLLEQARAGELSAIAVAKVYRDGTTGSGWSEVPALAAMIGAVTTLQAKLVEDA